MTLPAPVIVVRGELDRPLRLVRLVAPEPGRGRGGVAGGGAGRRRAARAGADGRRPRRDRGLEPGDVAIAPVESWDELARAYPPDGAVLVAVPDGLLPDTPPDPAQPAATA